MELILSWLSENAENAPYLIFGLLLIAGFSLPISEDLLLIASGVLASTVMPERTAALFLAVFMGSFISDIIAYGLGRYFGDKVYKKTTKLEAFYQKYGMWTLVVGRCIPFGIRNGVFMTAGAARMHFGRFLVSDFLACLGFSGVLFFLAYSFGSNFETLVTYVHHGGLILFVAVVLLIAVISVVAWRKRTVNVS